MPNRDDLVQTLVQLDVATFEDVIRTAYRQRYDSVEGTSQPPPLEATPQDYVRWLAKRHLSTDASIECVVYLPTDSPDNEVRLLEVNRFLSLPVGDVVEPLDFTPDTDPPFKVFVADITTDQWERIKQSPNSLLPRGWRLDGNQIIRRG